MGAAAEPRLPAVVGLGLVLVLALATSAPAQIERSDVARALREFEAKYAALDAAAPVKRTVRETMAAAVDAFFRGDAAFVVRALHDSIDAIDGLPPDPRRDLRRSLGIEFERRFVSPEGGPLRATLTQFMAPARPLDWRELVAEVRVDGRALTRAAVPRERLESGGFPIEIAIASLPPGEHAIEVRLAIGREPIGAVAVRRFDVEKGAPERTHAALLRIEALRASAPPETRRGLALATAEERLGYVRRALEGVDEEVEIPPRATLLEMEDWLERLEAGGDPLLGISGDQLLAVADASGARLPFRAYVPPESDPRGAPSVLALHGAGGSEHMYFEAYGAGALLREARGRGFAAVAPRSPSAFGLRGDHGLRALEALGRLVPLDPTRRCLTGHSMGASQALFLAIGNPSAFAAVAPIAGGLATEPALAPLRTTPVYLACGDRDTLSLGSARTLASAAAAARLERFRYDERPGLDHLLIVGETMPEVFAFFDAALAARR